MTGPRHVLLAPISWAVIISIAGALVTWGVASNRLDTVEKQAQTIATDQRQTDRAVSAHDTQIAVLKSQLDTIIRQLNAIDEKLERQERRQR